MRIKDLTEEYLTLLPDPYHPDQSYPIFKNPSFDEIKELSKEGMDIRFIAYKGSFFVFSSNLLHHDVLMDYLNLSTRIIKANDPRIIFLGEAEPLPNGKLHYLNSSQRMASLEKGMKDHPFIAQYF